MNISLRAQGLKSSATVAVMNRAAEMKRQGIEVLPFAAGEPDFDTPQLIKQAAIDAMLAGQTKYAPTPGDAATRKVISDKLTRENGLPNCTPDHVVISAGNKNSLYLVLQALIDPPHPSRFGGAQAEMILPVPAGSVVVTSGLLPHRSGINESDAIRRAYLCQFSPRPVLDDGGRPIQMAVPLLRAGHAVGGTGE